MDENYLKGSFRSKNQISGEKSFSIILTLEIILSVVTYEKNIIFYTKI